jgi:hypothetical protein
MKKKKISHHRQAGAAIVVHDVGQDLRRSGNRNALLVAQLMEPNEIIPNAIKPNSNKSTKSTKKIATDN